MSRFESMSSDEILAALDEVRKRTCDVPDDLVPAVDELVKRGVYPSQEGKLNTPLAMVRGWGAYWHVWREPLACSHCGSDLRHHAEGPPFKREIGHYDIDEDATTKYTCPDCRQDLAAPALPRCRVCPTLLTKRQRLYCSRRCNHSAETARRKLRAAQALAAKLEAEAVKSRVVGLDEEGSLAYADVTQAEQFSRLVADGRREVPAAVLYPTSPSLWQRLRKRVGDAWATLCYLVGEHVGN